MAKSVPPKAFGQSILFGYVRLGFPEWTTTTTEYKLPFIDYKFQISRPGIYFSSLFCLGLGLGAWWIGKNIFYRAFNGFVRYLKGWTNGSKYLKAESTQDANGRQIKYSVVIYGASTKVGRSYAHFLVNKGFNLILVERDRNQLDDLEADIRQNTIQEPKITKIVLDKFDQDTLNKQLVNPLKEHRNSPVKIFVNCKNSRRKLQSEAA